MDLTRETNSRVYLDYNATTPFASFLPEQVSQWLRLWGNPSSIHAEGRSAKALLRETRQKVAQALKAHPLEIIFNSGGSEGNSTLIKGVFGALSAPEYMGEGKGRKKFLMSAVEHPSVRKTFEFIQKRGAQVEVIPVNREGLIDMDRYRELLDENTALVSVMLANNETGHIFPVQQMAQMAHEAGALFHTDAVQALGKVPVDLEGLGVDYATFSSHKFYALKGAGVLFVRKGSPYENNIFGSQERGRRGGTENLLAIASLGAMMDHLGEVPKRAAQMKELRDHMEKRVLAEIPNVLILGKSQERLPNTSNMVLTGVDGESLLMNLDLKGFAVSTGAACSSGSPEPSPVLLAMGLKESEAQSSLRVGLGWATTQEQVDSFVDTLGKTAAHLRGIAEEMSQSEGSQWV